MPKPISPQIFQQQSISPIGVRAPTARTSDLNKAERAPRDVELQI